MSIHDQSAKDLYAHILQRSTELEKLIAEKERELKFFNESLPPGIIRIALNGKNHTKEQYFLWEPSSAKTGKYRYISKKELDTKAIQAMIQREYCTKVLKTAKKEYKFLKQGKRVFTDEDPLISVYESMGPLKQKWITPVITNDAEYIKKWKSVPVPPSSYNPERKIFTTKQGEQVRSKSELLIADTLYDFSIPYRYEFPLTERNKVWALPDFIVLQVSQRKEYIWEHFGMMDVAKYCANALNKIKKYEQHNIFAGHEIVYTFESSSNPLDTDSIKRVIRSYFS